MFLKRLDIHGFKSFADKTRFDFGEGLTGIVGPNGCGKTNVVDAIKWVLGEQAPRSLRSSSMTEVLFKGAGSVNGSGRAEVQLYFSNDGTLDIESEEVALGRRLYRSGESEYLVNNKVVRLKDIRELLMGTGLTATSYFILEQGKIDKILSTAPDDRRQIFDEAAGISLFKSRKKEAMRKLDRMEENLTRLHDIIDEVDKRIRSLKNQAGRARRYQELTQRLSQLRMANSFRRYRVEVEKSELLDQDRQEALELETGQKARMEKARESRGEQESRIHELDEQLGRARAALAELNAQFEGTRHGIESNRRLLDEMQGRRERLTAELEETSSRLEKVLKEREDVSTQLENSTREYSEARRNTDLLETSLGEAEHESRDIEARLAESKKQMVDLLQQRSVSQNRSVELSLRAKSLARRTEEILVRREEIDAELAALASEKVDLGDTEKQLRLAIDETEQDLKERTDRLDALLTRLEETQNHLQDEKANLRGKQARLEVLSDLEARMVGLDGGVKEVIGARSRGELSGILGMVASFLKVDLAFAAPLERALQSQSQALVAVTETEALAAAEYLRTEKKGYARFYALDLLPASTSEIVSGGEPAPFQPLTREALDLALDGSGASALSLLREPPDSRVAPLLTRLLGPIRFVRRCEDAHRLGREQRIPGARYVSLQGTVVESDGSFATGHGGTHPGLIAQKNEIEILQRDVVELSSLIDELVVKLEGVRETVQPTKEGIAGGEQTLRAHERKLIELRSSMTELSRREAALRDERFVDETDEKEIEREHDEVRGEESEEAGVAGRLTRSIETLGDLIKTTEEDHQTRSTDRDRLREQTGEARVQLAGIHEKGESLRSSLEMLDRVIGEEKRRIDSAQRETQDLLRKCDEAEKDGHVLAERLQSFDEKKVTAQSDLESVTEKRDETGLEREQLAVELNQAEESLTRARERLAELDVRASECLANKTNLVERVREELEVDLDEEYGKYLAQKAEAEAAVLAEEEGGAEVEGPEVLESSTVEVGGESLEATGEQSGENQTEASGEGEGEEDKPAEEESALSLFELDDDSDLESEIIDVRDKLERIGNVNLAALDELSEHEDRSGFLDSQRRDLTDSRGKLIAVIERIDEDSISKFVTCFEDVCKHFNDIFRKLFGGGKADLILLDELEPLDCGIQIVAKPPGKELVALSQLSGGERTMTAVALLFAIFKSRPSPFCVLDEVDAALDDANVQRFVDMLKNYLQDSQFILITHSKRTMCAADTLYGVTMERSGISKRIAVQLSGRGVMLENGEKVPTHKIEAESEAELVGPFSMKKSGPANGSTNGSSTSESSVSDGTGEPSDAVYVPEDAPVEPSSPGSSSSVTLEEGANGNGEAASVNEGTSIPSSSTSNQ